MLSQQLIDAYENYKQYQEKTCIEKQRIELVEFQHINQFIDIKEIFRHGPKIYA